MRSRFAMMLGAVLAAAMIGPNALAAVVINMPPPPKTHHINVAAAAADAAAASAEEYPDVGELAFARYTGARTGTSDNYISGGSYFNPYYNNYGYGWPFWWGFPFFGFVSCGSGCSPCPAPCH